MQAKQLSLHFRVELFRIKRLDPVEDQVFGEIEDSESLHSCDFPAADWTAAKRIASLIHCNDGVWEKRWQHHSDLACSRLMKNFFEPGISYQVDLILQGVRIEIRR